MRYFVVLFFYKHLEILIQLFDRLPERFKTKTYIDANLCWRWIASKTPLGYGIYSIKHKPIRCNRFIWEFFFGEIPNKIHVLHKCDVRDCVNPFHLFLGTHSDNMIDMYKKNRHTGHLSKKHKRNQKFSSEVIQKIKEKWASGKYTQKQLCDEFGIKSQGNLSLIIAGKRYL